MIATIVSRVTALRVPESVADGERDEKSNASTFVFGPSASAFGGGFALTGSCDGPVGACGRGRIAVCRKNPHIRNIANTGWGLP